jgi:hypothetical protein
MVSELAIGAAGIYGVVSSQALVAGNFPAQGPLFDVNYTMNKTWTACCTHNYNVTMEFDMPPHPKDGKMHPHPKDHQSDWLQVDVDEATNKLIAHADLEKVCSGLEKLYADRKTDFNCVDYSSFRSTFVHDLLNPFLITITSPALVCAIMSLITMIFSCKLACAAKSSQPDNTNYNNLYYSGAAAPTPVVYSGVNYA